MPSAAPSEADKIEHPQSLYAKPDELIEDCAFPRRQNNALKIWEQDARQMLTTSGEGMPGSEEGINPSDHSMLGQVERARDKLQRSQTFARLYYCITRKSPAVDRPPSCSPKTRRGGLQRISPSCRSCWSKKMRRNHRRWGQILAWATHASSAGCAFGNASKTARQCGHRKKSTLPFLCSLVTSM